MKKVFLKSYQKKTDAELERIVEAKSDYEAVAREVALEILLERRGETADLVEKKDAFKVEKEIAIERKKKYSNLATVDFDGPYLYSELVVLLFTVFASPLVGGILLFINFKELKMRNQANKALIVGLVFFVLGLGANYYLLAIEHLGFLANIFGALVFSQHFWKKHIDKDLVYVRRPWLDVLFILLGVILVYVFAVFVIVSITL